MNLYVARNLIVDHRQDYNRDRLRWLSPRLYRLMSEARAFLR